MENLSEEFRNKKKTESFNLKKELIHYYDIVKKQSIVISKIEVYLVDLHISMGDTVLWEPWRI